MLTLPMVQRCRETLSVKPCKTLQPLWKIVGQFLTKSTLTIQSNIYPKTMKSYIHTKCCILFIEALFVIAQTWKQQKYSSIDEWLDTLWYIHTVEYYSAVKKEEEELLMYETVYADLKDILLSEKKPSQS